MRFTDADGMLLTCFATNTQRTPIARLELRHRQRARAEDRIRAARDTGLRNLPLHGTAQNQIWLEIVQIALHLPAWLPMLALTGPARRWEPKKLHFLRRPDRPAGEWNPAPTRSRHQGRPAYFNRHPLRHALGGGTDNSYSRIETSILRRPDMLALRRNTSPLASCQSFGEQFGAPAGPGPAEQQREEREP